MEEEIEKIEHDSGKKVYEVSYLFVPTIGEEHLPSKVTMLKDLIGERGGNFISEDFPRFIDLAYPMARTIANRKEKFANAYFGWVKFELESDKIKELGEILSRNEEIIRYLLVTTVKENTLVSKKPIGKDSFRKRMPVDDEPKVEINKEEVDAQIEALLAE